MMLLNTRKMQIKSTMIYHCISISMALTKTPPQNKNQNKTNKKRTTPRKQQASARMQRNWNFSALSNRNVLRCIKVQLLLKEYGGSSKNFKELKYQAISLLDIYPKELKAGFQTGICPPTLLTPLFITVKRQK